MTETNVILRAAQARDAQALLTFIQREVLSTDLVTFAPALLQVSLAQLQAAITTINQRADQLLLIAQVKTEVVGYLRVSGDDRFASGELGLIIASSLCRQGLGGQLLAMALDWAWHTGFQELTLTVQTRNQAAINLYQHAGFINVEQSRRPFITRLGVRTQLLDMVYIFARDESDYD